MTTSVRKKKPAKQEPTTEFVIKVGIVRHKVTGKAVVSMHFPIKVNFCALNIEDARSLARALLDASIDAKDANLSLN